MDDLRGQLGDGPAGLRESRQLGWQGWTIKMVSVLVVLVVSSVGVVVAIALFTQTFPTHSVAGPVVTSTCSNLAVQDEASGWVRFNCGGTSPAFSAATGTATAAPTDNFGTSEYSDLYIVQGTPAASCTLGTTASKRLDPGPTAVTFGGLGTPTGNWSYCADYANTTPKGSFSVAWSQ